MSGSFPDGSWTEELILFRIIKQLQRRQSMPTFYTRSSERNMKVKVEPTAFCVFHFLRKVQADILEPPGH